MQSIPIMACTFYPPTRSAQTRCGTPHDPYHGPCSVHAGANATEAAADTGGMLLLLQERSHLSSMTYPHPCSPHAPTHPTPPSPALHLASSACLSRPHGWTSWTYLTCARGSTAHLFASLLTVQTTTRCQCSRYGLSLAQ